MRLRNFGRSLSRGDSVMCFGICAVTRVRQPVTEAFMEESSVPGHTGRWVLDHDVSLVLSILLIDPAADLDMQRGVRRNKSGTDA